MDDGVAVAALSLSNIMVDLSCRALVYVVVGVSSAVS